MYLLQKQISHHKYYKSSFLTISLQGKPFFITLLTLLMLMTSLRVSTYQIIKTFVFNKKEVCACFDNFDYYLKNNLLNTNLYPRVFSLNLVNEKTADTLPWDWGCRNKSWRKSIQRNVKSINQNVLQLTILECNKQITHYISL